MLASLKKDAPMSIVAWLHICTSSALMSWCWATGNSRWLSKMSLLKSSHKWWIFRVLHFGIVALILKGHFLEPAPPILVSLPSRPIFEWKAGDRETISVSGSLGAVWWAIPPVSAVSSSPSPFPSLHFSGSYPSAPGMEPSLSGRGVIPLMSIVSAREPHLPNAEAGLNGY